MGKYLYILVLAALCYSFEALSKGKTPAPGNIPDAARVRIVGVDATDPNYPDRANIIGKFGVVGKGGLSNNGSDLFSGPVSLDNGRYLYFDKVSVETLGASPAIIKGTRYTGYTIGVGKRVRVLEIAPTDLHYIERGKILGKICTVSSYDLYNYGSNLFSGQVACDDGTSYYFYAWALEIVTTKMVAKPATAAEISIGTRAKIKSLGAGDSYYYTRSSLVGKEALVTDAPMRRSSTAGGSYYVGYLRLFSGGSYYYFTEVEIEIYVPGSSGSLSMGPGVIPVGTMVQIESLGPFDKFYAKRRDLEGKIGVVGPSDSLRKIEGTGFYSGTISLDGNKEYFYQIAVTPFEGGLPSQPITQLSPGTPVKILDVSKSDGNAKDKALFIGKTGTTAGGGLTPAPGGGAWYSGAISTKDGNYYYFTQVAVLPLGPADSGSVSKEVVATGSTIAIGTKVRIIDIGSSDGSYTQRGTLVSKIAVVTDTLRANNTSPTGLSYYYGMVTVDGVTYYPYYWSFTIVSE